MFYFSKIRNYKVNQNGVLTFRFCYFWHKGSILLPVLVWFKFKWNLIEHIPGYRFVNKTPHLVWNTYMFGTTTLYFIIKYLGDNLVMYTCMLHVNAYCYCKICVSNFIRKWTSIINGINFVYLCNNDTN